MYKLIKLSSVIIRQFLLPNPFSALQYGELYNWVASFLLLPITYFIVGLFYKGRTAPALGSFLFLAFYFINTCVLLLCGVFNFRTIACITIGIVYGAILSGVLILKNQQNWGWR